MIFFVSFIFVSYFMCVGIFYTRILGSTPRRCSPYHQTAGSNCVTNSTLRIVHPDSSSEGTPLSRALPKTTWGMFCWNAKSRGIQIWKKGIVVALLEDIFCYMCSLLFCILYSRLLIIQNNGRELTHGRPGLDRRIIINRSSRNKVWGHGLGFSGLGYRQMAGSCRHADEPYSFIKYEEFDLCCSGMLCSTDRPLVTGISGQPVGPIFKGQAWDQ